MANFEKPRNYLVCVFLLRCMDLYVVRLLQVLPGLSQELV